MNIKPSIVGLGYVGLPLACLAATKGFEIIGFDKNSKIIKLLKAGKSHIDDDDVNEFLSSKNKNISFTNDVDHLKDSNFYIICVPTPVDHNNLPDLGPLQSSIKEISVFLKKNDTVVIESTVFPGTCENIIAPLIEDLTGLSCKHDINLCHCPERVNPGDAFWKSDNIPRVLGSLSDSGSQIAASFYSKLLDGKILPVSEVRESLRPKFSLGAKKTFNIKNVELGTIVIMNSIRDAEAVKAMENTVRDVNIAFVNELAKISDVLGLNLIDIIDGMSTKPFGKGPFYPGIGVGGHCIAVDPEWLKSASQKAGYFPEIIELSRKTNSQMPNYSVDALDMMVKENATFLKGMNVLIIGAAYKKDVNDLRESPFYDVKALLEEKGANVNVFDSKNTEFNTHDTISNALEGCQALIIVTDHSDLVQYLDENISNLSKLRFILDGRNCLNLNKVPDHINYRGIGRAKN